jgi:sigma-B regulation protein RsbU (phosphoserine phosphatase)
MLVIFSDGVTEAFNADDEEFGEPRLLRLLQSLLPAPPTHVCEAVVTAVRDHAPGAPGDDLTILALKRTFEPVNP